MELWHVQRAWIIQITELLPILPESDPAEKSYMVRQRLGPDREARTAENQEQDDTGIGEPGLSGGCDHAGLAGLARTGKDQPRGKGKRCLHVGAGSAPLARCYL